MQEKKRVKKTKIRGDIIMFSDVMFHLAPSTVFQNFNKGM